LERAAQHKSDIGVCIRRTHPVRLWTDLVTGEPAALRHSFSQFRQNSSGAAPDFAHRPGLDTGLSPKELQYPPGFVGRISHMPVTAGVLRISAIGVNVSVVRAQMRHLHFSVRK